MRLVTSFRPDPDRCRQARDRFGEEGSKRRRWDDSAALTLIAAEAAFGRTLRLRWARQPRSEHDPRSGDGCAAIRSRPSRATPPIHSCIDPRRAGVLQADLVAGEIVQVNLERGARRCRRLDYNVSASSRMMFCAITVPVIGARLKTLIPVGPLVAASASSAPLPEISLPTIMLSSKTTEGRRPVPSQPPERRGCASKHRGCRCRAYGCQPRRWRMPSSPAPERRCRRPHPRYTRPRSLRWCCDRHRRRCARHRHPQSGTFLTT